MMNGETNHKTSNSAPVLTKARTIYIHTGNIVNSNRLKRVAAAQSATSELSECISGTIQVWQDGLSEEEKLCLQDETTVSCRNKKNVETLPDEEREEYRITVKIFVGTRHKEAIRDAVRNVLSDLGVSSVETVILSVPLDRHSVRDLVDMWRTLEEEVEAHRVYSLGVSDLNLVELEELYEAVKVKPIINQVNLTTCCVIPTDLSDYAKEHDVQLLTHNDPPVILSEEDYERVISTAVQSGGSPWRSYWVARYSVLIKSRGVIKTKGFILAASREIS